MGGVMRIEDVINFVQNDSVAAGFFDDLAGREKNYRQTTVERARAITKASRAEVISMFRSMENLGLGKFITGRRGAQSRFEWSVSMVDAGLAATGKADQPITTLDNSEYDVEDEDTGDELINHEFRLRDGINGTITIALPNDLTMAEARRLGLFISSLPIVGIEDGEANASR